MPTNKDGETLRLLMGRFSSLKLKLETTAYQIKLLGGTLPVVDEHYFRTIEQQKKSMERAMLYDNEWTGKAYEVMLKLSRPCAAKEISEILYGNPDIYNLSSIHTQVVNALRILKQNGIIGILSNRHQKYYLLDNSGFCLIR